MKKAHTSKKKDLINEHKQVKKDNLIKKRSSIPIYSTNNEMENNENEELKQRIQKLETAFAASASALARSSSTMEVTTVAENNKHFV